MPDEDDILDYEAYDADWDENISMYYDYNLLDLLEEISDELEFAENSYFEIKQIGIHDTPELISD